MADLYVLHPKRKTRRDKAMAGAHNDYRRSDTRYPRDKKEAGIEDLDWEDRLPPMRGWMFWLAVAEAGGVCGSVLVAGGDVVTGAGSVTCVPPPSIDR